MAALAFPVWAKATTACGKTKAPTACMSWSCENTDGSWGWVGYPEPEGTGCGTQGACDSWGTCVEPPIISGSVYPKWLVVAVYYTPPGTKTPGTAPTAIQYGVGTTVGFGMTEDKTYKNSVSYTDTTSLGQAGSVIGSFAWSVGFDYSTTNARTKDWVSTFTDFFQLQGPNNVDGIDHGYDTIALWLNPQVDVISQGTTVKHKTHVKTGAAAMEILFVQLQWLVNPSLMPTNIYTFLTGDPALGGKGIPVADFAEMAKSDPFYGGSYIDPNRFQWITYFQFETAELCGNPTWTGQKSWTQSLSSTTTSIVEQTTWASMTYSGGLDFAAFISTSFQYTDKFAFTQRTSNKTSTGSNQSVILRWGQPSCTYSGGIYGNVYVDLMFHTYMVALSNIVGP
jgi:hypothetical protein